MWKVLNFAVRFCRPNVRAPTAAAAAATAKEEPSLGIHSFNGPTEYFFLLLLLPCICPDHIDASSLVMAVIF